MFPCHSLEDILLSSKILFLIRTQNLRTILATRATRQFVKEEYDSEWRDITLEERFFGLGSDLENVRLFI